MADRRSCVTNSRLGVRINCNRHKAVCIITTFDHAMLSVRLVLIATTAKAGFFRVPSATGNTGRPETWQIQTLDTGRYRAFQWRKQVFNIVPAMLPDQQPSSSSTVDNDLTPEARLDQLFKHAMSVLQRCSVALNILLCRYEMHDTGMVLATQCPLECLRQFVLSQRRQDLILIKDARQRAKQAKAKAKAEHASTVVSVTAATTTTAQAVPETTTTTTTTNDDDQGVVADTTTIIDNNPINNNDDDDDDAGDDDDDDDIGAYLAGGSNFELSADLAQEGKKLRSLWAQSGTSLELYRAFAYSIFRIRAQIDPPMFILASLIDNDHIVVCCRHAKLFMQEFYTTIPGYVALIGRLASCLVMVSVD
jgi:hypothetical protein